MGSEKVRVSVRAVSKLTWPDGQEFSYVLLADNGRREFGIFIGHMEALYVQKALVEECWTRPLPPEVLLNCITGLGGTVEEADIYAMRCETYYSRVRLRAGDCVTQIEMRPSDAINLALRAECPIYVVEDVLVHAAQFFQTQIQQAQGNTWPPAPRL